MTRFFDSITSREITFLCSPCHRCLCVCQRSTTSALAAHPILFWAALSPKLSHVRSMSVLLLCLLIGDLREKRAKQWPRVTKVSPGISRAHSATFTACPTHCNEWTACMYILVPSINWCAWQMSAICSLIYRAINVDMLGGTPASFIACQRGWLYRNNWLYFPFISVKKLHSLVCWGREYSLFFLIIFVPTLQSCNK